MQTTQVRIYRIKPEALDAFVEEWQKHVVPLRRRFGFEVVGAWASEEADTFVWILSHDGDFGAADREYYLSPERAALDPDPARHIEEPRAFTARAVPLP
jgi:NIPSNAP protein